VQDDRPESIASALRTVLADRERARAMGAAGRRRAEQEFGAGRVVEIVERAYRAMLDGRAAMASARR
jgi:glycosyltransferase involved in cell wall biosynthesis